MNSLKNKKMKQEKGITLLALVVTIVVLIILATVAINFAFGDNGIVSYADKAKFETEIASAREQIELVLSEAGVEKTFNSEYDENGFLDDFVEARLTGVELDTDEITYEGFIFPLDRSVPKLGEGEPALVTGPRIREIKVTGTTTNSISVEVDARNAAGGKYTYSYKKVNEETWIEALANSDSNQYTYEGLEENQVYNLKVKLETKEGSIENDKTSANTGELPQGTITFTGQDWVGDGTAKVTINTSAEIGEKYELQYIIIGQGESTDGIENMQWTDTTSGYEITGLHHGDTVYGRLYDGVNQSDYASASVEDKIAPEVNVTAGGTTSNSVAVSVNATDGQSGMKDIVTYTYSIKVTGQADSTYTTPGNANGITANTYTFTGLTQGTNYTVRVQVNGDKAGLIGTGTLTNETTVTVGGATAGLVTGNITASTPIWSNGTASIKLSTSTGYKIMYQKNTTTGQWIEIANGGTISGLNHNDTVYARLYDGNNYGNYASVTILDNIAPTISNISTSNVTLNSITVQVNATDAQSGIASYTYTINGGGQVTTTSATQPFNGLNAGTSYTIQVTVTDRAGHAVQESIQVTTKYITVADSKGKVTKFTNTTPIKDDLDNIVYIPGGFHIAGDSATKVEGGIVIQDDYGNQFVWIPVGTYKTSSGSKTNALSRRTFTASGATTVSGDTAIVTYSQYYYGEGDSRSVASSQIGAFLNSAKPVSEGGHGGFYIGRYEQGTGNVCKAGVTPYVTITRDTAKSQAEAMYSGKSEIKATSQLISSYAWDTALNFICQTNSAGYTLATTKSSSYGNIGTGSDLFDIINRKNTGADTHDNYSNIHDLLGNCREWTTEFFQSGGSTCTVRGGSYGQRYSASSRMYQSNIGVYDDVSFRSQLYM